MAIHNDYPGLKVEIVVNGQALQEYEDKSDKANAKVVTRYVEARAGAAFSVVVSFEQPFQNNRGIAMHVLVDGNTIRRPVIEKTFRWP